MNTSPPPAIWPFPVIPRRPTKFSPVAKTSTGPVCSRKIKPTKNSAPCHLESSDEKGKYNKKQKTCGLSLAKTASAVCVHTEVDGKEWLLE